jgi:hypothetical protein
MQPQCQQQQQQQQQQQHRAASVGLPPLLVTAALEPADLKAATSS